MGRSRWFLSDFQPVPKPKLGERSSTSADDVVYAGAVIDWSRSYVADAREPGSVVNLC